ncbi:competence protein [Myroides ceti]|uniref:Competence protein n=1 Tax=Paenimyroides ceti TaxID=395087 RepID=A0ABT8CWU3_9FLAO|nr:competence protein [Paenimyroides ceti]MDN3708581.1 competence protein [Paenimyroides ceti]
MALNEEIKQSFEEIKQETKAFLDSNIDYYQLWAFKITTKATGLVLKIFVLSLLLLLALLFLSFAAAFAIGSALDSTTLGFLIIGGTYLLVCLFIYSFRRKLIDHSMIRKFSDIFFN